MDKVKSIVEYLIKLEQDYRRILEVTSKIHQAIVSKFALELPGLLTNRQELLTNVEHLWVDLSKIQEDMLKQFGLQGSEFKISLLHSYLPVSVVNRISDYYDRINDILKEIIEYDKVIFTIGQMLTEEIKLQLSRLRSASKLMQRYQRTGHSPLGPRIIDQSK